MLAVLLIFSIIGPFIIHSNQAIVGATIPLLPPSAQHILGTDAQGRDLWTVIVLGTPNSLKIGLIAGVLGTGIGLVLGLVSGFSDGLIAAFIRVISDALLTVPNLAILIIIAATVPRMSVELMGLVISVMAWMFPTRVIRSQVLSIRARSYVELARANGVGVAGLIFKEIMPNLMPYVVASFVGTVAGALLAAVGLEVLGLGATNTQTLGVNIYWALYYSAVARGLWWWWAPPIAVIAFIFMALFVTSEGMDRFANPRLGRD